VPRFIELILVSESETVQGLMRRSNEPQPALGAAIRELREKSGRTQEALAQGAGITVAHLSGIERGYANPKWSTVERIADALGVSLGELVRLREKNRE
jgi:transcriptional regulator with XRE-family HTH domain